MDRVENGSAEAGKTFLNSLYETVMAGGEYSLKALEELSSIAFGGNMRARELSRKIDEANDRGELTLPKNEEGV